MTTDVQTVGAVQCRERLCRIREKKQLGAGQFCIVDAMAGRMVQARMDMETTATGQARLFGHVQWYD